MAFIYGTPQNDTLNGTKGFDIIYGNKGDDIITGGCGADWIFGGAGADIFNYDSVPDSPASFFGIDTVSDFQHGKDKFDFSDLGPLTWTGNIPTANGVWFQNLYPWLPWSTAGFVNVDNTGDGVADLKIRVFGFHLTAMDANDFILTAPNQPPVVVDDEIYVTDNTSVVIPWSWLLGNDSDPDSDPLSITAVSITGSDEFSVDPFVDTVNQTITFYTDPSIIANADTTLSYTVSDGTDTTDGTVSVHVLNRLAVLDDDITITDTDYQGSYLDTGGNLILDKLTGGNTHDVLIGGPGADRLTGNGGNDVLTGGPGPLDGADQFRFNSASDGTDVITDFTINRTPIIGAFSSDKIGINQSFVNFANTGSSSLGTTLSSSDYKTAGSIAAIGTDDNGVVEISASQTTAQITGDTGGSGVNIFALVFNSDTGKGEMWFDTDWSNTADRVQLITFDNITTLVGVTNLINSDFVQFT
jgi:Ca2+-binding RTX toxin-like protein